MGGYISFSISRLKYGFSLLLTRGTLTDVPFDIERCDVIPFESVLLNLTFRHYVIQLRSIVKRDCVS